MDFLSILWFILIAVLWTMYFFLEGFDFGVGMLLPTVARNEDERTQTVRTIGPHWDGNEVWLLTAGGATFAAFPAWYATMFSGMYLGLFVILVLLILRISALEWRSKINSAKWRSFWDKVLTVASYGVPLIFGVAFSNLVTGMNIFAQNRFTLENVPPEQVAAIADQGTTVYNLTGQGMLGGDAIGGFVSLFTPYSLLGGVMLVVICMAHGAQFLSLKTTGAVEERSNRAASVTSIAATVLGAIWVLWGQIAYTQNALAWIPLAIAAVGLVVSAFYSQPKTRKPGVSFIGSSVAIAAAVAWIFSAMAPNVMESKVDPAYSLTIPLASSTTGTLQVMTFVAVIFVPVVLAYTAWSYWVFRGRVSVKDVDGQAGLLPDRIRPRANFLTGKQS